MFVLTRNKSIYKEGINNIISKIVVLRESKCVFLNEVSEALHIMQIEKLNIFSIYYSSESNSINFIVVNNGSEITYAEIKPEHFIIFLNGKNNGFIDYNKDSLYLVKGGNYLDIKILFALINHNEASFGRGGSQKSHILSNLDFRLSCYLMAMFGFNHKLINYLNTFNDLDKDRYLSWLDRFDKSLKR